MADETVDETVTLEWTDSYDRSIGPPGAKGNNETGVRIHPELTVPVGDSERAARVLEVLRAVGISHKEKRSSRRQEWAQYDAGITDAIANVFIAAGSVGAIASVLKNGRAAWEAWLTNRSTRRLKVKLKDGTEVTVRDVKELDRVLTILQERMRPRPVPPPPDGTPGEW